MRELLGIRAQLEDPHPSLAKNGYDKAELKASPGLMLEDDANLTQIVGAWLRVCDDDLKEVAYADGWITAKVRSIRYEPRLIDLSVNEDITDNLAGRADVLRNH